MAAEVTVETEPVVGEQGEQSSCNSICLRTRWKEKYYYYESIKMSLTNNKQKS